MPWLNRTSGVLILTSGLFVLLWTRTSAEPPAIEASPTRPRPLEAPDWSELPEIPPIDASQPRSNFFDEQVLEAFEKAANGDFEGEGTGIAIADDILKVIKEVGPISARLASETTAGSQTRFASEERASQRARVAEQILRAARLLEQLGGESSDRVALIRQMREEARQVLSE